LTAAIFKFYPRTVTATDSLLVSPNHNRGGKKQQ